MTDTGKIKSQLGGGTTDVPIVQSFYQLYKSFHEQLTHFPKSERYTLGATVQSQLLVAFESVVAAAGTARMEAKINHLEATSAKVDLLRLLIRLAKDCRCLSNQAYLELESNLHEIGRMLGGWLKSLKN